MATRRNGGGVSKQEQWERANQKKHHAKRVSRVKSTYSTQPAEIKTRRRRVRGVLCCVATRDALPRPHTHTACTIHAGTWAHMQVAAAVRLAPSHATRCHPTPPHPSGGGGGGKRW